MGRQLKNNKTIKRKQGEMCFEQLAGRISLNKQGYVIILLTLPTPFIGEIDIIAG